MHILRPCLVLAALLAACHVHAQDAGRVLVAAGEVSALRAGRAVALAAGDAVQAGDVVQTGEASAAQLRLTDGSLVALRGRSQFSLDQYRYTGADDGLSEAAFRLVRGGLRTLTGIIGSDKRDRYRLVSPVATIGIRGTAFTVVSCQQDCFEDDGSAAPDGTYGVVFDGRVVVANDGGEREFGIDEAFFVSDLRSPAQPLAGRPGLLRDRLEARARRERTGGDGPDGARGDRERAEAALRPPAALSPAVREALLASGLRPVAQLGSQASPIVVTELRDADGNLALLGPGLGAGAAFSAANQEIALVDGGRGAVVLLDGNRGLLEGFSFNSGAQAGDRNGSRVVDGGAVAGDGAVTWGRWTTGSAVRVNGVTGEPPTGVHFFFGNLTPESFFGTLGPAATSVLYNYAGGTNPTDATGAAGQFIDGLFLVNFLERNISGGVRYRTGSTTWELPVFRAPITSRAGWVGFSASGTNAGTWSCTACSGGSGTIDSYTVTGLFLGSRAQNLGVTFGAADSVAGRSAGTAIFRCNGTGCR